MIAALIALSLIPISILIPAQAAVYQPGVKPGMTMRYMFLHYSDIKEATVTVTAVQGNLVTLRTQSTY